MALTWNVKECDQSACWNDQMVMTTTCECMIWATMVLGIDEITTVTVKEFAFRLEADRRLVGTFRNCGLPFTIEDVRPFIGLKTNATRKTRAQWSKNLIKTFEDTTFKRANA